MLVPTVALVSSVMQGAVLSLSVEGCCLDLQSSATSFSVAESQFILPDNLAIFLLSD